MAATSRSSSTFSVDEIAPLYVQKNSGLPAIVQRVGSPLVASAPAQSNTPPPLPPNGTAITVGVFSAPAPAPAYVQSQPSQPAIVQNVPSGISSTSLILVALALWAVFFIL
ncbi:MAG TPA: hypothetical protein VKJ65_07170 [Phycisphaerae bacterium]|nr:hypothetical protein [Phycisphaerae bacterium]